MIGRNDPLPELPLEPPDNSIYCAICQGEIYSDDEYSDYADEYAHKKCEQDQ